MNLLISKSIFSFFKYSDEFVWSWTQRSFVFLSHSGGRVAQLLVQLAKLIPSCCPQEPSCSLRPHQPSAGAYQFLKSPHQRWTHNFTHFLFGHPFVERLESIWTWACLFYLLASCPSWFCLAIPPPTSRVSRRIWSACSHYTLQVLVSNREILIARDYKDYFPIRMV